MSDWNAGIIEEFRGNSGVVGGMFEGIPLLLLHHVGAKTGTERVSPLAYQAVNDGFAIFASKAGADSNPDWHHNLLANPETKVEAGTETVAVSARMLSDEERQPIWDKQKVAHGQFAEYEAKTDRVIPVFLLEKQS
ncbi:MAG: nitroreductase family deazaflavin-dependent oxidoreductase [Acidimicrobiia bacterium]|nr:nitroreductase family deazaflavin-dependent oxidoreductase [Acidimicrobiia bacterium]